MARLTSCLSWSLVGTLYAGAAHSADDAYDDEARIERPETTDEKDESDEGDEPLRAGGLAAPEAMPEAGDDRSDIEKELDEAEQKDSGRGLQFAWLNGEIGYQLVGLNSLADATGAKSPSGGLTFGVGAGIRVLYFTLGARFRHSSLSDYKLWSLGGELGLRVPLGAIEPYAILGVGFAQIPGSPFDDDARSLGSLRGFDLRPGAGLDYHLSDTFSVGAKVTADLMFLSATASDDSGLATSLTTTAVAGLHF